MFSKDSTSTFAELLQGLEKATKSIAKTSPSLIDIKQYQFGVDFLPTIFPYLTVLPINEKIIRFYTSDICEVERTCRFEINTFKPTQDASFGQATGLINNIRLLFAQKSKDSFWRIRKISNNEQIVFNSRVEIIKYEDPLKMNNGVHSIASVDITFKCTIDISIINHLYPQEALSTATSQKEIIKIIFEMLEDRKAQVLPEVKQVKYGIVEPLVRYPGVVVTADNSNIEHKFAGADTFATDINIYVYSDLIKGQNSIYENMHIIDKIRSLIFANKYVLNRCYDYSINLIQFGIKVGQDLTFYSQLTISTKSLEKY